MLPGIQTHRCGVRLEASLYPSDDDVLWVRWVDDNARFLLDSARPRELLGTDVQSIRVREVHQRPALEVVGGCWHGEQRGQSDADEAEPEFLERAAPCDGLGDAFREFIELVVHNFPFGFGCRRIC